MQGLGAKLKARARQLGMSDSEVARRLDLSQPRYAAYTNDTNEPDLVTLGRICRALATTPDVVLGFAAMPEPPDDTVAARIAAALGALAPARKAVAVVLLEALASMPNSDGLD